MALSMRKHKFSIIICNYNYQSFVGKSIESCLQQDYPKELFEIIIVDDGSTDESLKVIETYAGRDDVKITSQANYGQAAAFKAGVNIAKNQIICLLDSDDYFLPHKLSRVSSYIEESFCFLPENFFLSHDLMIENQEKSLAKTWFADLGLQIGQIEFINYLESFHTYPFANPSGQIYSHSLIQNLLKNMETNNWKQGADNPIAHGAAMLCGGVHLLHEVLAIYRVHGNNFYAQVNNQGSIKPKRAFSERTSNLVNYLQSLVAQEQKNQKLSAQLYERCLYRIDSLEESLKRKQLDVA
jgi:glycosyltransferase involved in cell wall biosynthesis